MRRAVPLLVSLTLGCSRAAPSMHAAEVSVRAATAHAMPDAATVVDASTSSASDVARDAVLAALRRHLDELGGPPREWPMTVLAGPWSVRERGAAAPMTAAIVSSPRLGGEPGALAWIVSLSTTSPEVPARVRDLDVPPPALGEALVRDVDRDGGDELVLFLRAGAASPAGRSVAVYTVDTSLTPTWESLVTLEWQLDGARDAASLDADLASLHRDEAPTARTSPERFVARLALASPAGLRAMIDARGLRVCEPPPRSRRTRCRSTPAARLDDAGLTSLRDRFFALQERSGTDPPGFGLGRCRREASVTSCSAVEYTGNASLGWTISGAGASMRLTGVSYELNDAE